MSKRVKGLLAFLLFASLFSQVIPSASEAAVPVTLANPGFESGLSDWTQYGNVNIAVSSTNAQAGSKSLLLADTYTTGTYGVSSQRVAASAGVIYRASVKRFPESGAIGNLALAFYNSANGTIREEHATASNVVGQWNDVTVTFQAPAGTVKVGVLLISGASQTGNVYFDEVKLEKSNVISGQVTLQSPGSPPAWAKVNLYDAADSGFTEILASAYTDASNAFKLQVLDAGNYKVRVIRSGYVSQTAAVQVVDGVVSTANFALQADGAAIKRTIAGTVTNLSDGLPVPGATVKLYLERDHEATYQQAASVTTDAAGKYAFPAVPSDRYFVKAEKIGYVTTREPVYVYGDPVTDANVQLPAAPEVFNATSIPKPPSDHPRLFVRPGDIDTIKGKRTKPFFQESFDAFDAQRDDPGYTARSQLNTSTNTFTFPTVQQARYIRLEGRGNIGITASSQKGIAIREVDVFKSGSGGARQLVSTTIAVYGNPGYTCGGTLSNAIDNDSTTHYCNPNADGTLTLDLGSSMSIHSLDIAFYKETERVYLFDIKVSQDNSTWQLVDLGMGSSDSGELPAVPANYSNVVGAVLLHANANAFAYLLDPVQSHANGEKAVDMALHIASSAQYPLSDNNGITGPLLETMALVYDWCYDLFDNSQERDQIYNAILRFAGDMEMKYNATGTPIFQSDLLGTGHGGEGQLFRYLLGAAIAVYGEHPDIYDRVVPLIYNNAVPVRNYFYESESHHQGESYTGARYSNELWMSMLFTKMGLNNPFNGSQRDVLLKTIYSRRPDGQKLRDGDGFNSVYTYLNTVWKDQTTDMLAASLFDNPYVNHEFIETYEPGKMPIYEILFLKDNLATKSPDDLPRSHYFNDPEASMIAQTGWDAVDAVNHNSPTVIAEMKIGNRRFGNHEHLDFGSFQLYYKGGLAIDSGLYEGSGGAYNSPHDVNYHKRTIAHNAMLVMDPNERWGGNDGGQRWRDTGPGRSGIDAQTVQDVFGSNYKFAEVQGRAFGPDLIVPNYTYIKGDLSSAYTDKVEQHQRSMVFLNLKNGAHPAAMIVFDRVVASDPSFKKYWLLHSIDEPNVNPTTKTTTITRATRGDTGKLVNQTLLPDNAQIDKVGGPGHEFDVFGTNYPSTPLYTTTSDEQGAWRIQVTPSNLSAPQKEDLFLNVIQVMDSVGNPAPSPLPVQKLTASLAVGTQTDAAAMVGAQLADRAVLFSASGKRLSGIVTLTTTGSQANVQYVVTDLQAGTWKITGNGVETYGYVSEEGGALYFTGAPGTHTLTRMLNVAMTLTNPGFENGLTTGWTQYVPANPAVASSDQAYSGAQSVLLDDVKVTGTPHGIYGVSSGRFPASEGEVYRASAKSYLASGTSGRLVLVFYNSANQTLAGGEIPEPVQTAAGQWNTVTVIGKAPAGTATVGIRLLSGDTQISKVYFDDVALERATLVNPGFESSESDPYGLYGWTQYVAANPAEVSTVRFQSGSKSVLLDDQKDAGTTPAGIYGANAQSVAASPGENYRATVKSYLEPGAYGVLVLVFYNSANGTVAGGEVHKAVTGTAGQWNEVTVTGQAPPGTAKVGIRLISGHTQKGKVYFDDAVLERQ
ncbi:Heparinase II/III-like protein [Cohnella sp. OV330]|uniref:carboxypeptidase regulatory-like domain-containing protein n=1 Tax=Cohnella sp. OV330 TaxID=1855288 RepID=UPI0008F26445|nr:carboxypeptidase regulatory-like domain-containing protein [Cohnella sp. OV330]SFB62355.1 Heparinase II/III-like protein [Cohnella sp. OV330]